MKQLNNILNICIGLVLLAVVSLYVYPILNKKQNSVSIVANKTAEKEVVLDKNVDQVVSKYLKESQLENLRQQVRADKILKETKTQVSQYELQKKIEQEKANQNIPLEQQIWTADKIKKEFQEPDTTQPNEQVETDQPQLVEEKKINLDPSLRRKPSKVEEDSYDSLPSD